MWQICKGDFVPHKCKGKFFEVDAENCREIALLIKNHQYPLLSLNEKNINDFDLVREVITNALEEILPEKSVFEK